MELSRLASSLAAYSNNAGSASQANQNTQQSNRSTESVGVSRAQPNEKSRTGSAPAAESTRVSLSQEGQRRAAEDVQSNQQASNAASQAASGRVTAVSAPDSPDSANPRSAISVVRTDTPQANAQEIRQQRAEQADNKIYEPDSGKQNASQISRSELENKAQQKQAESRAAAAQEQESNRARARQDAPNYAQSGVSAYQGVSNY